MTKYFSTEIPRQFSKKYFSTEIPRQFSKKYFFNKNSKKNVKKYFYNKNCKQFVTTYFFQQGFEKKCNFQEIKIMEIVLSTFCLLFQGIRKNIQNFGNTFSGIRKNLDMRKCLKFFLPMIVLLFCNKSSLCSEAFFYLKTFVAKKM